MLKIILEYWNCTQIALGKKKILLLEMKKKILKINFFFNFFVWEFFFTTWNHCALEIFPLCNGAMVSMVYRGLEGKNVDIEFIPKFVAILGP